jgi:hypothetical protein
MGKARLIVKVNIKPASPLEKGGFPSTNNIINKRGYTFRYPLAEIELITTGEVLFRVPRTTTA